MAEAMLLLRRFCTGSTWNSVNVETQEKREHALRARYDKVIADLQAREDKIREDIVKEISDLDKRMSLLEQKLESINQLIEQIKARVFKT